MAEPRKRATTRPDPLRLVEGEDGALRVVWREYTIRFLFSDGSTVDVRTSHDDSDLRGALLDHFKVERIEGSVRLDRNDG